MDAWFYEHGKYEDKLAAIGGGTCPGDAKNALGYRPNDCAELRYKYDVTAAATGAFTAEAENTPTSGGYIWPGCATSDKWTTNQKGEIEADGTNNVLTACD